MKDRKQHLLNLVGALRNERTHRTFRVAAANDGGPLQPHLDACRQIKALLPILDAELSAIVAAEESSCSDDECEASKDGS